MTATQRPVSMVTGRINDIEVTVPAGTNLIEAARQVGVEIPNLCFQPKLRAWGSCRICTVEVLGNRGGLIEGCATPLAEGMDVRTHTPEVEQARQFILQMYLIDHALDCPTCDASGQCYLQDNTYLHNINANPYRRPKMAHGYEHFSGTIDYKWDRCIMCVRCTRVCDEVIGVTAIESANRSLEATITPAFGLDLSETTCTNCGMCIASCPVGALTDRHFAHHPWEVDTTETVCGGCDGGCTINLETNRGLVRRVSHLWDRGVNHGYTCQYGKWGHEEQQSPDRLTQPLYRGEDGFLHPTDWDDAIERLVEGLEHHQGDHFAAIASPDQTTEEAYLLQQFTRAVMGTNNIDRHMTPAQRAVDTATVQTLGPAVSGTNNLQELFTDVRSVMIVGPDINKATPIAAYWINHAKIYREAKLVVVSPDRSPLTDRADIWLQPRPGSTADVLLGIASVIATEGLSAVETGARHIDARLAAEASAVDYEQLCAAARIYATGGVTSGDPGPSVIYNTAAREGAPTRIGGGYAGQLAPGPIGSGAESPADIAAAANLLATMTGNLGRAGGGVMAPRGSANFQGVTDAGARPDTLPGGVALSDAAVGALEAAWTPRWAEKANTRNGFVPVRRLSRTAGIASAELPAAIERGDIRALYIEGTLDLKDAALDPRLLAALPKLDLLIVAEYYPTELSELADIVLPLATSIEKDGTFTSFDRTVQRVRSAVPAPGNARSSFDFLQRLARRFGYAMDYRHPGAVMAEIATMTDLYRGVAYARLERGGITVPSAGRPGEGIAVLPVDDTSAAGPLALRPRSPRQR